jgi:hypothetical protein
MNEPEWQEKLVRQRRPQDVMSSKLFITSK